MAHRTYDHVVIISATDRTLTINRRYSDGNERVYAVLKLPSDVHEQEQDVIREFAAYFGESILMDSAPARKILDL